MIMIDLAKSRVAVLGVALGIGLAGSPAFADRHDGHDGHDDSHWHGDIHSYHGHDYHQWHSGHWYHGDHYGHLGWWWLAGGMWYYYPVPVYPYPNPYAPSTVIVQSAPEPTAETEVPPAPQSWYYCQSARKYYPYVSECPEGWKAVPATPPGVPSQ